MNKKGQVTSSLSLGEILVIFVAIMIGIAMLGYVFSQQSVATELQPVTDESDDLGTSCYAFNISGTGYWEVNESNSACNLTVSNWYDTDDWKASASECNLDSVVVTNSTGTLTLTEGTDYNLYEGSGVIQMLNTSSTNSNSLGDNETATDYNYCADGYNTDSGARGIAGFWGLFSVLIILAAAVYGIRNWIQ